MGLDEISYWYPRVGAVGDQLYGLPGAKQLDNSQDTLDPTALQVGDSSIYSATPTLAEIIYNAATNPLAMGVNQAIAYLRRRTIIVNALIGGVALPIPAYLTETKMLATHLSAIETAINNLRLREGFTTTYVFSAVTAATIRSGKAMAEIRKALRIFGIVRSQNVNDNLSGTKFQNYLRLDTAYPATPFSEAYATMSIGTVFGKRYVNAVNHKPERERLLLSYPVHSFTTALVSAVLKISPFNFQETLEAVTGALYTSNTDDSAYPAPVGDYAGVAYNTNNLEGTFTNTVVDPLSISIVNAHVTARAGNHLSVILASKAEVDGTGTGGAGAVELRSFFANGVNIDGTNKMLILDFGA